MFQTLFSKDLSINTNMDSVKVVSLVCISLQIALCKSEEVKAILYEYNDTPILRLKQQLILRGNVTIQTEQHGDDVNYLKIQLRKKDETYFQMFETLDFKQCNARDSFYCVQDKNTYLIYLNTPTMAEFNQSEWRMHGSYNGYEFSSNAVILPIVHPNIEVHLFKFNQSYSKCEQDLLTNEEIVLEGHVQFHGDFEEDEMYITIENKIRGSTKYNLYSTVFLNHCETSSDFKCTRDGDLNSYRTTLTLNATKDLSESYWRLAGKFKGTSYYSTPVQLPRILDPSDIQMQLNKQKLFFVNATSKTDIAEFTLCCIEAPIPCIAVITINSKEEFKNATCVTQTRKKSEHTEFMFGYRVCGNNTFEHKFRLTIENKDFNVHPLIMVMIVLIVACVFFFLFPYLKKKVNTRRRPNQVLRPENEIEETLPLSNTVDNDTRMDEVHEPKEDTTEFATFPMSEALKQNPESTEIQTYPQRRNRSAPLSSLHMRSYEYQRRGRLHSS